MFEDCVLDNEYEICVVYPHVIRNKRTGRIVAESMNNSGYINVGLNDHIYGKHVVVATQWIPNDDPLRKTEVNHKNKQRDDNRPDNLEWCTRSYNLRNRSGTRGVVYEFIEEDDLPDDLMDVEEYSGHYFVDYYYSPTLNRFIFWTGVDWRMLHINRARNGAAYVYMQDVNGVNAQIRYSVFKRMHDLV